MKKGKWKFAVDRGGTFTDVIGKDPNGKLRSIKVLSDTGSKSAGANAFSAIKDLMGVSNSNLISSDSVDSIRFGTTVATNALLEGRGDNVILLITKGFRDLLEIGDQSRPDIFSLCIKKSHPLYCGVIEVDERVSSDGSVIKPIDVNKLFTEIDRKKDIFLDLNKRNFSVCIVFLHSWINPDHEILCEGFLKEYGIDRVYCSHKSINRIKVVSRGQSAVLDSYLGVVLDRYISNIIKNAEDLQIQFILNSGDLVESSGFTGKDSCLSGPAGGVMAVRGICEELGLENVIGFDMGGTSTDVCRYEAGGELERVVEQNIKGIKVQTEGLNIVSVASGGGSKLWFDGQKIRVGPKSAGAMPGPACYGFGGPLTITDANLATGRILPEYFPKFFGINRNSTLNVDAASQLFNSLTKKINEKTNSKMSPEDVAYGFLTVASETMAGAIRKITLSRGYDVRNHSLVCFGGAGGQHACQIANILDIEKIIYHPLSSVMSAYGIGLSNPLKRSSKTIFTRFSKDNLKSINNICQEIISELKNYNEKEKIFKKLDITIKGSDATLRINYNGNLEETTSLFKERYCHKYGFYPKNADLIVVNVIVEAESYEEYFPSFNEIKGKTSKDPLTVSKIYYKEGFLDCPVYKRILLPNGFEVSGPSIILDKYSTFVVERGFSARCNEKGILIAQKAEETVNKVFSLSYDKLDNSKPDPVLLEVFNNLFRDTAIEMGYTLKNTAHSVNIKEREDFSCAIFNAKGDLIANAPHVPVHLGSMSDTVKGLIEKHGNTLQRDDVYLTNNPYSGGTHLPDITVICPVFSQTTSGENILRFFTAARGHHSDIGGKTPGSMPAYSQHIEEEGVLIDNFLYVREGRVSRKELMELFESHKYRVRNMEERFFDIDAQVAACKKGVYGLNQTIDKYGWSVVDKYMYYIWENAAFIVKTALAQFLERKNVFFNGTFTDYLDDKTPVCVKIKVESGNNPPNTVRAEFDFTGTGGIHEGDNLNAPASVTKAAIMYVLRAITNTDIPLNGGCLSPVVIKFPHNCILNSHYPYSVASGNVETSQRIVDVLLGAFGIMAASQGTMNNLLFEIEGETTYYETIAGGAGAMSGCCGASAVQIHMTNTKMTDPEILELRHPGVRLEQFKIKEGTGGDGKHRGGNGLIRVLKFLKPATVTIISERRTSAPFGMNGGIDGSTGRNTLLKENGETVTLPNRVEMEIKPGDSIKIETPGGGGYGAKSVS